MHTRPMQYTIDENVMKMTVTDKPRPGELLVNHLPVTIGRDPIADIRLSDGRVSRFHCIVDLPEFGEGLVVRDLGSRYGTYVNGEKIREAPLANGDILTIGTSAFKISYDTEAVSTVEVVTLLRRLHHLWRSYLATLN